MNTVLPGFPPLGAKLMHAPDASPLIAVCPATRPPPSLEAGNPPGARAERTAGTTTGVARTQVITSAMTSAERNRAEVPCRRRVRAVTLAGRAIGRVILVALAGLHVWETASGRAPT